MTEADMIKQIFDHMWVLNREMGEVLATLNIIKWFLAILIATSLSSAVTAFWSLILHRRNNKQK